eukprot:GCRY01001361.1.p1 GENE.GCRY01001361.1~~GCRY01001361.1.p1  ORF type:complete len:543 (+),score=139.75 GCRY01001361.1:158-1786(+)
MAMRLGINDMLKEGTKLLSGLEEAVLRNTEAAKKLTEITRTSLGPNGRNKMVVNHLNKLFVTNDAATILNELEVQHPAAKVLVMSSQMQEKEIGDGTNLCLVFGGELLNQSTDLIRMGLHPSEIIKGYQKAGKKAEEILNEMVCYQCQNVREKEEVVKALKTVLASKQLGYEDFLTEIIAEACIGALPSNPKNFNVDNVRTVKIPGEGIFSTRFVKGMVIHRDAEGSIKSCNNAKVAVFTCAIAGSQTETKGTVLIENAEQLKNFSKGEEKEIEDSIKAIAESGVNVVVGGTTISDMALHFLERYKIMCIKVLSRFEVRRVAKAVGAVPLSRLGAPLPEEMGHCDQVYVDELGDATVTVFKQDEEDSAISTIVIRGSTDNILDDLDRSIDDGVNVFKAMCKNPGFVPGAGATEIELARQITSYGGQFPGLEQYAIKKYAEALEVVPRTLAENAGMDALRVVHDLYKAHQEGAVNTGLNIEDHEAVLLDANEQGIYDHLVVKRKALQLALDAAETILKVDQIIMAKTAGGPKMPQQGARDADD